MDSCPLQGMGIWTRTLKGSTFCFRRPRFAWWRCLRRQSSPPNSKSLRSRWIRPRIRSRNNCPLITPTRLMAMLPAPLVFVNYGLPEDYEKLDRLGISVKGAIVIAKYLHSWRGVKPKVAAEHGAIGCLIYSEPQDDGYTRDNVFPAGADASRGWSAARQRYGFCFGESGRSADAGHRRDSRCEAPGAERCEEHHENSGAADFLRRRAAFAGRAGGANGAGGVARLASDSVSRGTGAGAGPFEGRIQLGHQAGLRRDRENPGQRRRRTNGSFAAIITTRG